MGATSGSRGVVLVVEDEPLVRMVAAATIEDAGFETIEAVGAESAIAILEVRKDIRIVFADIHMPGRWTALRLARVVRDRWPPIELILTSGLIKIGQRDLPERSVFLAKPYSLDALTAALTRFDDSSAV
jgi:Response regulator containing CheY-like receiver, AAA-type ATPase, and DNA-binding domains